MDVLYMVLSVVFVLISIAITVIVLMQEGKQAGLGSVSGMADSYWGKNKGRSVEGKLEKITTVLGVLFILLAVVLNMGFFFAK